MTEAPAAPDAAPPADSLAPVDRAPTWRRQPYRLFFPLAVVMVWAGIVPWLFVAWGWLPHVVGVYHSIVQIQGFMLCFALGFLFTMIPRRTKTEAPTALEMALGLACPVAIVVLAALEELAASQGAWFVLAGLLVVFAVRRFRRGVAEGGASRGPLPGFVWIPVGLAMGIVGAVLFGVYGALGPEHFDIHELAKLFLLQGLFLSLVVGVGSMVLPLFTRGEGTGDRPPPPSWARRAHLLGALALVATFLIQVYGNARAGYLLRAALCAALLVWAGRIHRPPSVPGANRWLVWLAAWAIPAGFAVAGALPAHQFQIGLHLVFLGGFAVMGFAVSAHVALAHGGRKHVLAGWPWQIVGYGACFWLALAARGLMQLDLERYSLWLGVAAGLFLAGTVCWAAIVAPVLLQREPARPPA